ncbi:Rho-type GTPase-activating protein 3 [Ceratobasidium theobromae]|uniref:Rho-type GTPase-activating protein 3 n=1 Tax=Ceratobasidium theobromae TaxID=1582974 RepID=A0A5N5QGF9_9AGAM|nr:Rho-type GTPase-activating protein 3 [Ceratobasidium theobromae]
MACHNDRVARSRRHADRKRTKRREPDSLAAPDLARRKSFDDRPKSPALSPGLQVPRDKRSSIAPRPRGNSTGTDASHGSIPVFFDDPDSRSPSPNGSSNPNPTDGPPAPPPKDASHHSVSVVRSSSSSSSSPVIESTATYGAMQLPPMRFSLGDTDFADLLKGIDPKRLSQKDPDEPRSSLSSTYISLPDLVTPDESATASILDDHDTQSTPVIRTTLAPDPPTNRDPAPAADAVLHTLRQLAESHEHGPVKLTPDFLHALTNALGTTNEKYTDLKRRYDGIKVRFAHHLFPAHTPQRTSQQFIDGLSVAQSEYDKELAARRDAEAEVTRLRVQLSGQTARLTALTAQTRIQDLVEQQLAEANATIRTILRDVAKLRTDRDMLTAEIEELAKKDGLESLESRLEALRKQYRKDLEALKLQREGLVKEITELKEHRDIFLEETTALNARNEELAELNSHIQRQLEQQPASTTTTAPLRPPLPHMSSSSTNIPTQLSLGTVPGSLKEFGVKARAPNPAPSASVSSMGTAASINSAMTTATTTSTLSVPEEKDEVKPPQSQTSVGKGGGFKWLKAKPAQSGSKPAAAPERPKGFKEHTFIQQSVLRFARCDHCGDKMWGMQMRCNNCNIACHHRCTYLIKSSCQSSFAAEEPVVDISPLAPSMFGRDLVEQVRADAKHDPGRMVPLIVDKCIRAVEASAMDYEGIYRKTGGSSLSKAITQLFERGDYDSFDLEDTDVFNDISSITSVMKTYFRQLPNPLLTFALHEQFVEAAGLRDAAAKHEALVSLVRQLPLEHYHTLRFLMLHLSRVKDCSEENLMSARNIGVVFGPTLMRSADPSREFGDMAGKALTVEWLVDNAPAVFSDPPPS